MSKEFKHLKFGLAPVTMDASSLDSSSTILKSFLSAFDGFNLISDTESHKEVFGVARRYIGSDFRNWLIVNFRSGSGARRELARKIAGWIEGKFNGQIVIEQVKMDLNRISYLREGQSQIKEAIIYDGYDDCRNKWIVDSVSFANVTDKNFFDLCGLLGPELMAKFCLSLDGIYEP